MKFKRFASFLKFAVIAFTLLRWGSPAAIAGDKGGKPHLNVELVSEVTSIQPGGDFTVGIRFRIEKGWHLYWKNSGDSGLPPSVSWRLPMGFKAGEILWPLPKRLPIPSMMDFGYEDEVLLITKLHAPAELQPGKMAELRAEVKWLVCKESCVPGKARLSLILPVKNEAPRKDNRFEALFERVRGGLPSPLPNRWKASVSLDEDHFEFSTTTDRMVTKAEFFPLNPNEVENNAPQIFSGKKDSFKLLLKRSEQLIKRPSSLRGLLVVDAPGLKKTEGFWIDVPLKGGK